MNIRDITKRKREEAERQRLTAAIEQAAWHMISTICFPFVKVNLVIIPDLRS